ncbi:MAG: tetratricopeptide repeat protein, partial [Pseudomonadota bacterium]
MSNTDSFIEEVTEEVRRDRLYAMMRRYGWIAVLAIILIVGGTAWNEWRKAQAAQTAQARGDAITQALSATDPAERAASLQVLAGDETEAAVVAAFLAAAEFAEAGDPAGAGEVLSELAARPDLSPLYRDLAQIKRLSLDTGMEAEDRALTLDALSQPGAPYRTVALELAALDLAAAGDVETALSQMQDLLVDAETSQQQERRIADIMRALGGTPELASPALDG